MSTTKVCLKCKHKAEFDGAPPLACPACGAIYSKVEAAMRTGAPVRPSQLPSEPEVNYFKTTPSQAGPSSDTDVHAFARQMRAESLYPAWRKIVGLFAIIGYIAAAIMLIAGIISGKGSTLAMLAAFGFAALTALFTKVGKELSLMLADLSDATVHLAARNQER